MVWDVEVKERSIASWWKVNLYGLVKSLSSPLLSMAALTVEHLKVMAALSVEPACASSDGGDGGDGGLNSRARNPSPYE